MNKTKTLLAATLALALAFTLSCSSDDDDGGSSDGRTYTFSLKNVTESSFTTVEEDLECKENGQLEKDNYEQTVSYSIEGKTLSFWMLEFSGNSSSLTGTWTREPFSATCENDYNYYCEDYNGVSKAVFTQNTLTITECIGKVGEEKVEEEDGVTIKRKIIDCGTREYTYTKGNETVKRVRYYGAIPYRQVYTYNGKSCTYVTPSESQMRTACTQAYNKVKQENPGYSGNDYLVEDEYYNILEKDFYNCLKSSFPTWFLEG